MRTRQPVPFRAFAVAPLAAPAAYFAGLLAIGVWRAGAPTPAGTIELLAIVFAVGAPIAYIAAICAGVPLYVLLATAGWLKAGPVCGGAAAIGALTSAVIQPSLRGELFSIPLPIGVGAALGAVTGIVFWMSLPD